MASSVQRFTSRMLSTNVRRMNVQHMAPLASMSVRRKSIQVELRSGRVGKMKIADQSALDKLFERTGALGLVAEESGEEETIDILVSLDDLQKDQVYQIAYGADEGDAFEQFDGEEFGDEDFEEVEEEEPPQVRGKASSKGRR